MATINGKIISAEDKLYPALGYVKCSPRMIFYRPGFINLSLKAISKFQNRSLILLLLWRANRGIARVANACAVGKSKFVPIYFYTGI